MTTRREISTENIMFPRVLGYKRRSDIKEGDITKIRVYVIAATRAQSTGSHNNEGKWASFAITLPTPVSLASDDQGLNGGCFIPYHDHNFCMTLMPMLAIYSSTCLHAILTATLNCVWWAQYNMLQLVH